MGLSCWTSSTTALPALVKINSTNIRHLVLTKRRKECDQAEEQIELKTEPPTLGESE